MNENRLDILLFICDWCANPDGVAADLQTSPANLQMLRVKCSGRIDPTIVFEAFQGGVDGVIILGCEPGNCHFIEGNLQAERKVKMVRKLLALAGFEPERLELRWASAVDPDEPAEAVGEFIERIRDLGASPLSSEPRDPAALDRIIAARTVLENFRMRAFVGRELELIEKVNIYGEKVLQPEFDNVVDEALESEFLRCWIYLLLKRGSLSVKELAEKLGVDGQVVLRHIVVLQERGMIIQERIVETTPLYLAP